MSVRMMTIANCPDINEKIKEIRKIAKESGFRIIVRGRCKDRKAAFAKTGRQYSPTCANGNDIYLRSKEAPYADAWVLYRQELPREWYALSLPYKIKQYANGNGIAVSDYKGMF